MKSHPFVLMDLPCEVDVDIAPLVRWLNALPGIRTLNSCQGGEGDGAYVNFLCSDQDSLAKFMSLLVDWAGDDWLRSELEVDFHIGRPRYTARWKDNAELVSFLAHAGIV